MNKQDYKPIINCSHCHRRFKAINRHQIVTGENRGGRPVYNIQKDLCPECFKKLIVDQSDGKMIIGVDKGDGKAKTVVTEIVDGEIVGIREKT